MCGCDVFVLCSLHRGVAHWNCIVFPGGERNCGVHELICVRKGRADQSSGRLTFDPCTAPPPPPVWSFITTEKHLCVCFWLFQVAFIVGLLYSFVLCAHCLFMVFVKLVKGDQLELSDVASVMYKRLWHKKSPFYFYKRILFFNRYVCVCHS